jgi:hypothetical protein
MAQTIVLQLPDGTAQRYQHGASAARKGLEEFLIDRLKEVAPPQLDGLPEPLRDELRTLEDLDDEELRQVSTSTLPSAQQRRYSRLLRKAAETGLTVPEQAALREIGDEARRLTLRRAHAYLVLKWRGHLLPTLTQLASAE